MARPVKTSGSNDVSQHRIQVLYTPPAGWWSRAISLGLNVIDELEGEVKIIRKMSIG